jgi:lipopolysaccharide transport system ATP-binding protein
LKLLSNITRPASGRVLVSGRISSLLELGAGFHPELTGRENIYLNGAILGMKRGEIARKIDDIVAFAELERFIETPVKRYSSGMYVRLGFAVAAHVEPDILLVDEVLAVGDASFRHRCTQRMHEMQRNGTTVVFVSHNMHQVRNTCDNALLLMHGQIRLKGTPDEVIGVRRILLSNEAAHDASGQPPRRSLRAGRPGPKQSDQRARWRPSTCCAAIIRQAENQISIGASQPIGRIDIRVLREDGTVCSAIDGRNA